MTEAAKDWLPAQNDHPEWGARPLRRILRGYMREPLTGAMLQKPPAPRMTVVVKG